MINWSTEIERKENLINNNERYVLTLNNKKYQRRSDDHFVIQIQIIKKFEDHPIIGALPIFDFKIYPHPIAPCPIKISDYKNFVQKVNYGYNNQFFLLCAINSLRTNLQLKEMISLFDLLTPNLPIDEEVKQTIYKFLEFNLSVKEIYQEKLNQAKKLINSNTDLKNETETCLEIYKILSSAQPHPNLTEDAKEIYAQIQELKSKVLCASLNNSEKLNLDELSKPAIEFFGIRKLLKEQNKLACNQPIESQIQLVDDDVLKTQILKPA